MRCIDCPFSWGAEYDYDIKIDDCTGYMPGRFPLVTYCRQKPTHKGLWAKEDGKCTVLEDMAMKLINS